MSLPALLRNLNLSDHEAVLKAANASLKQSKTDTEAQHVRIVALLKLDRFEDAIRAFDEAGDKLKEQAPLEWAYALYKAGRLQDAEKAAGEAENGEGSRGMQHVLAQARYRLEDFEKAAQAYKKLNASSAEAQDEENDLRINSAAVDAQLEWKGLGHLVVKKKPAREDLEAFETAYNAACASIARGELAQGEILLKRARDLCQALEELSDEEKKTELVPIIAQWIYVLVRQGKLEGAEKLKNELDISSIPDASTKQIAQINALAATSKSTNPYLNHRLFDAASDSAKSYEPFEFQASILRQNSYAVSLQSLKYDGVARSTSTYIQSQPAPSTSAAVNTLSVLNAAAKAQCQVGKAGLKTMLPLLQQRPKDVGLLLTIIHLYLLTNNHGSAVNLIETFLKRLEQAGTPTDLDARYSPGLVGTLISLYDLQGRKSQTKSELAKAATYWRHKSKDGSSLPIGLLKAAGTGLLASSNTEDLKSASEIFTALHDLDPADRAITAGYVAAHASTSPSKLQQSETGSLTPLSTLLSKVDAAALEAGGIPTVTPSATAGLKRKADKDKELRKPKKLHKSRIPKDFDPKKQVDPERWLPLRDRSYYKPKGKKGKKRAEGLTQGGLGEEEKRKEAAAVLGGGQQGGSGKKKAKKRK